MTRRRRVSYGLVPLVQIISITEKVLEKRDRLRKHFAWNTLPKVGDQRRSIAARSHADCQGYYPSQSHNCFKCPLPCVLQERALASAGRILQIIEDWMNYLRGDKLWGNEDPLFPATLIILAEDRRFAVAGLDRKHWSNATPIRKIFREAFTAAGLPYFNPHSLRNTLVQFGETCCHTPEEFKGWSQNLGHEEVLTTFRS